MTVLYVVLAVLGALLLILLLPVFAHIHYEGELQVRLRVLGIPFTLYPRPQKEAEKKKPRRALRRSARKKQGKKAGKKEKEGLPSVAAMLKEDGVGGTVHYLSEMAALVKTAAVRVLRAITVRSLMLRLTIGGEDAAQTAIRHGAVCGAVFPALAVLEGAMRVRRREVQVTPDFVYGESRVLLDMRLSAMPLRLLAAAIGLILGFIGHTVKESSPPDGRDGGKEGVL